MARFMIPIMKKTIKCPFCKKGFLISGNFEEMATFSCTNCTVSVVFRESLEEIKEKYFNEKEEK